MALAHAPTAYRTVAEQVEAEFHCGCSATEIRARLTSNGVRQYVRQCGRCGRCSNALPKASIPIARLSLIPDVDRELQRAWDERRRERHQELMSERRAHRDQEWWARYEAYLSSTVWLRKRSAVLRRDGGQCQARMVGCLGEASQVHHTTYEHLFDEPLFELQSICSSCHNRLHKRGEE